MELNVQKPLRKYEAVVILHPDVSEEQQKELFRKNAGIIKQFGGDVNHIDTWGKRRLANPIKKLKMGNYFHTTFESGAECIHELERTMRINENVLRFTHVRLDDRVSLSQHLEKFKNVLAETNKREQEREAKNAAKRGGFSKRPGGPPSRESKPVRS
ncbi:MAG: 30S ribosomal protein S6 [Pseudobdellovibrionaceae bacterium]|nr:30S ribosomal protein S6 [Bdellovibrionales bacterium]USN46825.1 MAG: 30S ribosomal protein S6 [Pseudobdellovibrionaceae bacterium]